MLDFARLRRSQRGLGHSRDVRPQHQGERKALSQLLVVCVFEKQHHFIETRLMHHAAAGGKIRIQIQTPLVQLGRRIQAVYTWLRVQRDGEIVVRYEVQSGQEAGERGRGFARSPATRYQYTAAAMPHRRRMHQLTAVELHPPVENAAKRRRQDPRGQMPVRGHPENCLPSLTIHYINGTLTPLISGAVSGAVETPDIAALGEVYPRPRGRRERHAGGFRIPEADFAARPGWQSIHGIGESRDHRGNQRFPCKAEPDRSARHAEIAHDFTSARGRRSEPFREPGKEPRLFLFCRG